MPPSAERNVISVPVIFGSIVTAGLVWFGTWLAERVQSFDRTIAAQTVKLDALILADSEAKQFREDVLLKLSEHGFAIDALENGRGVPRRDHTMSVPTTRRLDAASTTQETR